MSILKEVDLTKLNDWSQAKLLTSISCTLKSFNMLDNYLINKQLYGIGGTGIVQML